MLQNPVTSAEFIFITAVLSFQILTKVNIKKNTYNYLKYWLQALLVLKDSLLVPRYNSRLQMKLFHGLYHFQKEKCFEIKRLRGFVDHAENIPNPCSQRTFKCQQICIATSANTSVCQCEEGLLSNGSRCCRTKKPSE